ncbi:MAG TPA: HEAT repeat domain-containing protein [Chloroflexia bacterium]|nr:HEAT repeat domain-containing protein [Chloroflexia bacterium]
MQGPETLSSTLDYSVEKYINDLRNRQSIIRYIAADALGQLGNRQAVEPLIHLLNDPDWLVRFEAARSLGRIGDPRALPALRWLQQTDLGKLDEDYLVQDAATEAFNQILLGRMA